MTVPAIRYSFQLSPALPARPPPRPAAPRTPALRAWCPACRPEPAPGARAALSASAGAMADKLDLDANPYQALGLGEGSSELTMAEIKKARRETAHVCCALAAG